MAAPGGGRAAGEVGMARIRRWIGWAVIAGCAGSAGAPPAVASPDPPPDPVVSYRIDVRLDPSDHILDARQTLTWRNTTSRPAGELRFHLYLNAFKNSLSTFMKESGGVHRGHRMREGEWGWIDVLSLRTAEGTDLLPAAGFVRSDEGTPDDETVLSVPLANPVPPGGALSLDIAFRARLPRVFARTGYKGDYHLAGQWYPKIGVLQEDGWNCHPFHHNSEFFADFGDFDVSITLPSRFVVGATGAMAGEPRDNGDGTLTHRYVQQGVHDFAWTADPRFLRVVRWFRAEDQRDPVEEARVARALGTDPGSGAIHLRDVEVTLLVQPEHAGQIDRYFTAVFHGIRYFGYWYGAYPYDTLTVVDPAYGARGSGGMEYPTFITGGTDWYAPAGRQAPESVTIHEFGHQYWYGLVATNEFEEAFLDEGLTTYSTGLVLERAYGANRDVLDVLPGISRTAVRLVDIPLGPDPGGTGSGTAGAAAWLIDVLLLRPFGPSDDLALNAFRDLPWLNDVADAPIDQVTQQRRRYLSAPDADALARRSWEYVSRESYGLNSYARTALVLRTLDGILGEDVMLRVMRTYFERFRFRHPTVHDFIATAVEVAGPTGPPLERFLEQAIFGSDLLDYAVTTAAGRRPPEGRGVFGPPDARRTLERPDAGDPKAEPAAWENEIVVKRLGGFAWPQEIALRREDGSADRMTWDGAYRWTRHEENGARLIEARVDPEERMALDAHRTNNARARERHALAGWKWWSRTLQWMQHVVYFYSGVP